MHSSPTPAFFSPGLYEGSVWAVHGGGVLGVTLSAAGTGTVVADGLSFMNAEFSSSSFRVMPVAIGTRNFLGNFIAYPAGGRTGDNCLLATKVMVPIAGPVREGVGLLGSPCFEIPRTVQRDHQFDHLGSGPELRSRLAAKNRHNAAAATLPPRSRPLPAP